MADIRNLTPEELEKQNQLLKERDEILQRLEERNKRMAVAGQEEIKRLQRRNEKDKEHLDNIDDVLGALKDVKDKADDYADFWEKAAGRQEEYLDMQEDFQTSFAKLAPGVKKILTSSTNNSNTLAAITARILELKKQEINATDEERKALVEKRAQLTTLRQQQLQAAEAVQVEKDSMFGVNEAKQRRIEFEASIVGLSDEDRKLAEQTFLVNQKLLAQQDRLVELKKQQDDLVSRLPEGLQSAVNYIGDMAKGIAAGLGPIVIMGALLAAALTSFSELEEAAGKFRQETGLTKSQTEDITRQAHQMHVEFAGLGMTAEDFYDTIKEVKKEFGDTAKFSDATVASMIVLNKNFGIAQSDLAAVNKAFQSIGGLSAQTSQNLAMQVTDLAKQVDVAPSQVFKDIAEASEDTYKYFRGDVTLLSKQAIEARRLGTNLKSVLKTTEGLLNFEEGIEKELAAAAMLGGQFNLSKARALAFDGKAVDAQKEILRQVQRYRKFADMDPITKQAVADATNMTVDELGKQLLMQEKLTNLSDEQKKLVGDAMDKGLDISSMNEAQLADKVKELKTQEEIVDKVTQLENSFKGIVASIGTGLTPLLEGLVPVVTIISNVFGFIFRMLNAIPGVFPAIIAGLTTMYILSKKAALMKMKEAIAGMFSKSALLPGLGVALAVGGIAAMMSAMNSAKVGDMAIPSAGGQTLISTKEGGIFEPSMNDDIAVGPGILQKLNTSEKISNLARANNNSGGGMGNGVIALVEEVKQLRKDMSAGKIKASTYLDGVKITSGISNAANESSRNSFSYGQRG